MYNGPHLTILWKIEIHVREFYFIFLAGIVLTDWFDFIWNAQKE